MQNSGVVGEEDDVTSCSIGAQSHLISRPQLCIAQWHSLASIYKSVWSHGRKGKEFYMASSVKSDSFSKTSVKMSHRRVKLETNHSLVFSKFDIQTQIFSTNCIVEGSVYFAGLQFKLFSSGRAPVVT